jgi:plasmid stability protein
MRTTVDIPDPIYRELKSRAAAEGRSVKDLVLRGVESILRDPAKKSVRRLQLPIFNAGEPGSLELDNEKIYDLIGFP